MLDLATSLNIKRWEDWYKIETKDVPILWKVVTIRWQNMEEPLFFNFMDALFQSVLWMYFQVSIHIFHQIKTEYNWKRYRFRSCPTEYWKEKQNLLEYFEEIRGKNHLKDYKQYRATWNPFTGWILQNSEVDHQGETWIWNFFCLWVFICCT